jgi:hypothetical protein
MKTKVVLDLTVSGEISEWFTMPNGSLRCYKNKETGGIYANVWRPFKSTTPKTFKINAFQVVSFKKITLPVVELEITKKKVSRLYEWFWEDFNIDMIYDTKVTKTSNKDITVVKLSTGETLTVDQDISYIENTINSLKKFDTEK